LGRKYNILDFGFWMDSTSSPQVLDFGLSRISTEAAMSIVQCLKIVRTEGRNATFLIWDFGFKKRHRAINQGTKEPPQPQVLGLIDMEEPPT
jgi:hypothetical protein